jgi:hypothetical protein
MEKNVGNTIVDKNEEQNIFRFVDKCTDSFIEFEKYENTTWINTHYVDPDNCKLFLLLLKSSLEAMKDQKCTEFKQLVLETDWNDFLGENSEWTIVEKCPGYENIPTTLVIKCNIDIAHELVIDGFLRNNNTF